MNHIIKILTMKIRENNQKQCSKNVAMSVIVCLSAGIMLIMNIIRHSVLMTITSVILVGGFAVLWLLLIPLFSISLFGLKIGMGMNAYFTILVLVLFYTPLNAYITELYTDNFIHRFPVLFIADSVTAQFLALSSEYYYRIARLQVYTDDMTGAYNRKYFYLCG